MFTIHVMRGFPDLLEITVTEQLHLIGIYCLRCYSSSQFHLMTLGSVVQHPDYLVKFYSWFQQLVVPGLVTASCLQMRGASLSMLKFVLHIPLPKEFITTSSKVETDFLMYKVISVLSQGLMSMWSSKAGHNSCAHVCFARTCFSRSQWTRSTWDHSVIVLFPNSPMLRAWIKEEFTAIGKLAITTDTGDLRFWSWFVEIKSLKCNVF